MGASITDVSVSCGGPARVYRTSVFSAAKFVRKNQGKMEKTGSYNEMLEKDPKFIAIVMSKMLDVE